MADQIFQGTTGNELNWKIGAAAVIILRSRTEAFSLRGLQLYSNVNKDDFDLI